MIAPIDKMTSDGRLRGRDAIWYCIRTLKTFSLPDLEILSTDDPRLDNVNRATARTYVHALEKGGYVERHPRSKDVHERVKWTLIKDVGINAPRLDRQGNQVPETKRAQMWRAIRILGVFDANAVLATTDEASAITLNDAKDYIHHLAKAKYLQEVSPASNGGGLAKYKLLSAMNTGPKPPMVQRVKQVFDPNLNKVVWPKSQESE